MNSKGGSQGTLGAMEQLGVLPWVRHEAFKGSEQMNEMI